MQILKKLIFLLSAAIPSVENEKTSSLQVSSRTERTFSETGFRFTLENSLFCLREFHPSRVDRFVSGFNFKTCTEPLILLRCDLYCFLCGSRPTKASAFQPLVQQYKSIAIPIQPFDPVCSPAAEQEQRIFKWIQLKLFLYEASQTVNPLSKLCKSPGQENF